MSSNQGRAAPPPSNGGNDDARIKAVIMNDDPKALVDLCKVLGKRLAEDRLATSQIRGIFGAVRSMQARWDSDRPESQNQGYRALLLLKPKLAYQAARNAPVTLLRRYLDPAIDAVAEADAQGRQERFRRFLDYFEALLSYHKAAGGLDKPQRGN
jgi:CRISPR-associated protein Csm2